MGNEISDYCSCCTLREERREMERERERDREGEGKSTEEKGVESLLLLSHFIFCLLSL